MSIYACRCWALQLSTIAADGPGQERLKAFFEPLCTAAEVHAQHEREDFMNEQ